MTGPGDHDPEQPRPQEPIGSVAEEAAKLLGALSDWAKGVNHNLDEHLATGAPECTYCPVCRTVHVIRETTPEVRAHVASAAASLMQAAASILAAAATPPSRTGRTATVENIDLDADWPEGDS